MKEKKQQQEQRKEIKRKVLYGRISSTGKKDQGSVIEYTHCDISSVQFPFLLILILCTCANAFPLFYPTVSHSHSGLSFHKRILCFTFPLFSDIFFVLFPISSRSCIGLGYNISNRAFLFAFPI